MNNIKNFVVGLIEIIVAPLAIYVLSVIWLVNCIVRLFSNKPQLTFHEFTSIVCDNLSKSIDSIKKND